MSTTTTFDLDRFARAAEERDASTQLSMYGPDAIVTIADKITQPGSPRVLRGHKDIAAWLEDMYGRDMTHRVRHKSRTTVAPPTPRPAATPTAPTCCARP